MTLYEIESAILECVDEETGEILDVEKLEQLELEREEKISNIACWIKNLKSDVEMLKAEEENLKSRRKSKEKRIESLSNYLSGILEGEKWENARATVSFRRTEKVVVDDTEKIPADYLRVKTETAPDKDAIKKALKSGVKINGARLEESLSMTVK